MDIWCIVATVWPTETSPVCQSYLLRFVGGLSRVVVVRGALLPHPEVQSSTGAILGSDVGQNGSENVRDHKLASEHHQNRSENSPTQLKTGHRFSFPDLSLTVNAQPGLRPYITPRDLFLVLPCHLHRHIGFV